MTAADRYEMDFRLGSYWETEDPITEILAKIKGERRKRRFKKIIAEGDVDAFRDWMMAEKLSDEDYHATMRVLNRLLRG